VAVASLEVMLEIIGDCPELPRPELPPDEKVAYTTTSSWEAFLRACDVSRRCKRTYEDFIANLMPFQPDTLPSELPQRIQPVMLQVP
jgi:hypothetical protein